MSNSALVSYTKLSPNRTSPRTHAIDTITIHCMAGNLSVESCGALFAQSSRQASSNYGIGSDGRIALFVDEGDRSWCSSSKTNDHRAVTIEVANTVAADPWPVSDKAYAALLDLVTDICRRNGIKRLLWQGDKDLIGQVSKQNMTVHRWFAAKACPGDYLYSRHAAIAAEVNNRLNAAADAAEEEDDDMEGKEIFEKLNAYLATLPTSDYAKESSEKGVDSGLFADGDKDGLVDDPRGILTREQLAVVLNRAGLLDK